MRLEWPGGVRELSDRPILIGRDPVACDVALEQDSLLSRLHFAVVPGGDGAFLLDLRSSNGTYVNGSRVHYARLRSGDQIRAGTGRFTYRDDSAGEPGVRLLKEPRISFLARGGHDAYRTYLQRLREAQDWTEALAAGVTGLLAQAREAGDAAPAPLAAFALVLDGHDPVATASDSIEPEGIPAVLGPAVVRLREMGRPFLVESIHEDLSFLPAGYPLRVAPVECLAAAPLGPGGASGLLAVLGLDPRIRLGAEMLRLVEIFAVPLDLALARLPQERAQG